MLLSNYVSLKCTLSFNILLLFFLCTLYFQNLHFLIWLVNMQYLFYFLGRFSKTISCIPVIIKFQTLVFFGLNAIRWTWCILQKLSLTFSRVKIYFSYWLPTCYYSCGTVYFSFFFLSGFYENLSNMCTLTEGKVNTESRNTL